MKDLILEDILEEYRTLARGTRQLDEVLRIFFGGCSTDALCVLQALAMTCKPMTETELEAHSCINGTSINVPAMLDAARYLLYKFRRHN